MVFYLKGLTLFISIVLMLVSGCVYVKDAEEVSFYFTPEEIRGDGEISRVVKVLEKINEENHRFKKSPQSLKESYASLKIRKLNEIPREEYGNYAQFLERDGGVYIIVHPAYYAFFKSDSTLSSRRDAEFLPPQNIVERFCDKRSFYDSDLKMMQVQEKLLKDFLDVISTERRLVILVLPGDYKRYLNYGYISGLDEYVRYINEATNGGESILYMESMEYSTGYMGEGDLIILSAFLKEIGAGPVMLGGGFAGRCLDNFYDSLVRKVGPDNIFIVPEITEVDEKDLADVPAGDLVTRAGTIDFKEIERGLRSLDAKKNKGGENRNIPAKKIRHLYIYRLNGPKLELIN